MSEIQKGSVVILKSGGPVMTVSEIEGQDAYCYWMDKNKQKNGRFPLVTLQIYNPPKPRFTRIIPR